MLLSVQCSLYIDKLHNAVWCSLVKILLTVDPCWIFYWFIRLFTKMCLVSPNLWKFKTAMLKISNTAPRRFPWNLLGLYAVTYKFKTRSKRHQNARHSSRISTKNWIWPIIDFAVAYLPRFYAFHSKSNRVQSFKDTTNCRIKSHSLHRNIFSICFRITFLTEVRVLHTPKRKSAYLQNYISESSSEIIHEQKVFMIISEDDSEIELKHCTSSHG